MAITRSTPVELIGGYVTNGPYPVTITVPSGAVGVLYVSSRSGLDGATLSKFVDIPISDTNGNVWTLRGKSSNDHFPADNYTSAVWVYDWFNASGQDVTLTVTPDFTALAYNPQVAVGAQVMTTAKDLSTYTPQVVTQNYQTLPSISITPSYNGSQIMMVYSNENASANPQALANNTVDSTAANFIGVVAQDAGVQSLGTPLTVGLSSPTDSNGRYASVAVEYYDSAATPPNVTIGGGLTVFVNGSTQLTANSDSIDSQKSYTWELLSGAGSFSVSNQQQTTFTPTQVGMAVVRCKVQDSSSITTATLSISTLENHFRVRSGGSWSNTMHALRSGGLWQPNAHFGINEATGGVDLSDGRKYTTAVLADTPAAYFAMQEVGGTAAIDWSGNGKHGAYIAGAEVDYAVNPFVYPPIALGRMALTANEVTNTQYIQLPGDIVDVTNGFAFEMWYYSFGWAYNPQLFYYTEPNDTSSEIDIVHEQNTAELGVYVGGTGFTVPLSDPTTDLDTWHHLVVSIPAGGGTATIYLDGVSLGSGTVGTLTVTPRSFTRIGSSGDSGNSFFNGFLTQAAIYGHPLSGTTVQSHYTVGVGDDDPVWHGKPEWYDPSWYTQFTNHSLLSNPAYVPTADWMTNGGQSSDIQKLAPYFDIGINTAGTDYQWFRDAGMYVIASPYIGQNGMTGTPGSETIAYCTDDEADMRGQPGYDTLTQDVAQVPSGGLVFSNFGTLVTMGMGSPTIGAGDFVSFPGLGIVSADLYWYAIGDGANQVTYLKVDPAKVRRASNYGYVLERVRSLQTTPKPLWGILELSHPNNLNTFGGPNPDQVEGAVWASIIGGARGIVWFHHTFAQTDSNGAVVDPQTWDTGTQYNVNDCVVYQGTYYYAALPPTLGVAPDPTSYVWVRWSSNSGAEIDNVDVRHPDLPGRIIKIKADLQTMAPAIYSPTVPHLCHQAIYSTYRPQALDGHKYIIAVPGPKAPDSGGTYTMHLPKNETPLAIEVVGENRTIIPSNGTFTDTFNGEYAHHIYRW